MVKLETLDNITEEQLDRLKELYSERKSFKMYDERAEISFDKRREYFLLEYNNSSVAVSYVQFTFIWINNNLWQYRYMNTGCSTMGRWENPVDILNKLLNDEFDEI